MALFRATAPSQGRRSLPARSSPACSHSDRNTSETTSSTSSREALPPADRVRHTVTLT